MTAHNTGRLAIHRRSDEIAFLQDRLRALEAQLQQSHLWDARQKKDSANESPHKLEVLKRQRGLADELIHTRQTEPLGETLQRRLAMAERICRDLPLRNETRAEADSEVYRVTEIERQALADMLKQWWVWLHGP